MIFGANIPEATGHQTASQFPPHPTSASTLPGKNRTNEILHFIQGSIITLLKRHAQCKHLVYISVTLADSVSKCPIVQLLQSMFEMSALCANTSTQTVSPCIDSSVNTDLLQTNPDFN